MIKRIGMIGDLGWESTIDYYRILNSKVSESLGSFHSANLLLYSFDFAPILDLELKGRWDEVLEEVVQAARSLEAAGAEMFVNTRT